MSTSTTGKALLAGLKDRKDSESNGDDRKRQGSPVVVEDNEAADRRTSRRKRPKVVAAGTDGAPHPQQSASSTVNIILNYKCPRPCLWHEFGMQSFGGLLASSRLDTCCSIFDHLSFSQFVSHSQPCRCTCMWCLVLECTYLIQPIPSLE